MKIRKKTEEPRDTVITIRLSQSEKQQLKELAAQAGLSVGAFLLGLALGDAAFNVMFGDLIKERTKDKS